MTQKIIEIKQTFKNESVKQFTPNEIQANIINEEDKDLLDIQSQLVFTIPYDILKNNCMKLLIYNSPTDEQPTIEGYINFTNVNYQDYQSLIDQLQKSIYKLVNNDINYLVSYDITTFTNENRIQLKSNKFFKIIFNQDNSINSYYLRKVLGLNVFNNYSSADQNYIFESKLIESIYYLDFDQPINFQNISTLNVMCNQLYEPTIGNNAHEISKQQNLTFQINTSKFLLMSESQQFTPGYKVSVNSSLHASVKSNVLINGLLIQFFDENFVEYKISDEVILKLNIAKAQKKIQKEADEQMYKQETEQQKQLEEQQIQQQEQQRLEIYNKTKLRCNEYLDKEILNNENQIIEFQQQNQQTQNSLEYAKQIIERRDFKNIYDKIQSKEAKVKYIDYLKLIRDQKLEKVNTIQEINNIVKQKQENIQKIKQQIDQSLNDFIQGKIYKEATPEEIEYFNQQLTGLKIEYNLLLQETKGDLITNNQIIKTEKDAFLNITSPEAIQQQLKDIYQEIEQRYQEQKFVQSDIQMSNDQLQEQVFNYNVQNDKQLSILDQDRFQYKNDFYKKQDEQQNPTTEKQMEDYENDQKQLEEQEQINNQTFDQYQKQQLIQAINQRIEINKQVDNIPDAKLRWSERWQIKQFDQQTPQIKNTFDNLTQEQINKLDQQQLLQYQQQQSNNQVLKQQTQKAEQLLNNENLQAPEQYQQIDKNNDLEQLNEKELQEYRRKEQEMIGYLNKYNQLLQMQEEQPDEDRIQEIQQLHDYIEKNYAQQIQSPKSLSMLDRKGNQIIFSPTSENKNYYSKYQQSELLNPNFEQEYQEDQQEESNIDQQLKPEINLDYSLKLVDEKQRQKQIKNEHDQKLYDLKELTKLQKDFGDYVMSLGKTKQKYEVDQKEYQDQLLKRKLRQAYLQMYQMNKSRQSKMERYKQEFGYEIYEEKDYSNWTWFLGYKEKQFFEDLKKVRKDFEEQINQIKEDKHE